MRRADRGRWDDAHWHVVWPSGVQPSGPWRTVGRRFVIVGFIAFAVAVSLLLSLVFLIARLVSSLPLWLVAGGLALLLLRRMIRSIGSFWRPARRLIDATDDLAAGNYGTRVAPNGAARGMRPLIASFNDMASRLEDAERQRRRLLADLGHELRTPLTVVRGEVEAVLDGVHDADPDRLRMLLHEVEVMERLLDDLGTLSRAEAGTLALHRREVDLVALLDDIATTYGRRADEADVAIRVEAPSRLSVMADPIRLREIVSNLVVNALHAMDEGGIVLGAQSSAQDVVVTVTDTGPGMEPEDLAVAFERFQRGAGSTGSGLGLTISRDLAEAHGGTLELASEPGVGTVATLTLPADPTLPVR